ncbi:hypothetical protein QFC24_004087 [Naganishia onofrii]|uniref:Uncharacterized protein n=1 Tax=Naganishia onofrii TaxID=1851511 RepID=A0ACC2XGV0_9TREE|nr:hypothetical protein QFC24_004087 [Naganishia onofrii]
MRHPWAPKNAYDILLPHDGADTSPNGSLASDANDGSSDAPIVASSLKEIPDEMTIPEFLVKQLGPLVAKMMKAAKSDGTANYVAKRLDYWVDTYFRHPEKLIKEPIASHESPHEYGWSGYTEFRNLLKDHLSDWVKHYKCSVNEHLVFQALDLFERIMKTP